MDPVAACSTEIAKLEPLLGIGLAFNLAYLNLPIFSFLTNVSREVQVCLSGLPSATKDEIHDTPWYKDALSLSKVHNLQTLDLQEENPRWIRFKSAANSLVFNVLFHYRVARAGCVLGTAFGIVAIVLGVAASLSDPHAIACWFMSLVGTPFWIAVIALVWPVGCVSAGAWVRYSTLRDLRYNLKNLGKKALQEAAGEIGKVEKAISVAGA